MTQPDSVSAAEQGRSLSLHATYSEADVPAA